MDFSVDFFRDEVRNGFYVPTAIKQAWAATLMVLAQIDRICTKHGITYFADWGTILGAVRHGGFVPWDDDLDICMKRDDYKKFREVADAELPKEFVIHDYERKENHWLFLSRVVNSNHICFDQDYLDQYHNFPYMAGVDIFLQDYLYPDQEQEKKRCDEIKYLLAVADGIVDGDMQRETVERELHTIAQKYNIRLNPDSDARTLGIELYRIAEQQMSRVTKEDAESVGQIFPWILKGGRGLPKEYYEKVVRLPFENTTIPVPACYNKVLQSRYGNYLEIRKVWNGHDYPFFEGQRENLQKVADFELPEFSFRPEMLKKKMEHKADSLKEIVKECICQIQQMTDQLIHFVEMQGEEEALALLPECQQMAVDLATLIEEVKGEERQSCQLVVAEVQAYCDALYEVYLDITGQAEEDLVNDAAGMITNVKVTVDRMAQRMQEQILDRREILFLPIGPKEWIGFAALYDDAVLDGKADVYVVPLPLLFKDALGRVTVGAEEIQKAMKIEEYPSDLTLTSWTGYDLKLHQPEQIYIQSPYDGENPCLTIPPQYYAKNLREFTQKLIYIPPFLVDEFGKADRNDLYNMKHYVTAPGVIYADMVLVQSENMKHQYVEKLIVFAGEETRNYWEDKIRSARLWGMNAGLNNEEKEDMKPKNGELTDTYGTDGDNSTSSRKKILYCIGLNELSEYKGTVVDSIRKRFEIFKENCDSIQITVCLYPEDTEEWNKIDQSVTFELTRLIQEYGKEAWCERQELKKSDFDSLTAGHDAYYGSASPLVPLFTHQKKPVMISEYGV